jgi:hypothetical protein
MDRAYQGHLHVLRQTGRNPIGVDFNSISPLWLKKDLVPLLIGKTLDFVLDRGAVARANAFDDTTVER